MFQMFSTALSIFFLCLLWTPEVPALLIPIKGRTTFIPEPYRPRLPRADTKVAIKSVSNTQYLANITVGGGPFTVIIDTGSSDLWLAGSVPNRTPTGQTASVKYAVGSAAGEINVAKVDFSGFSVPDQAFIYVQDPSSTGIDTSQFNGLCGLGPSASSQIRQKIGQPSADPFLDRVFRQNTSTPNFITFLLDRSGDSDSLTGQLTISEFVQGLEKVNNQPKVPVNVLEGAFRAGQHWSSVIDAIIGPDGQPIQVDSIVPGTDKGKLVAIFDTGFTLPQVSRSVSDAIYGRIQGAKYDTGQGFWTLPCDQEVNVTVVIGGQNYTVHPLDTSSSDLGVTDSSGKPVCVGTFQPITSSLDGTFDTVMGMAFLRNAYTLINFGDFVDGNPQTQGNPFMQFLSITDPSKAHKDFVKLRMNGVDRSGDSSHSVLPPGQAKQSPSSTKEKAKNAFFRYWPYLVGGLLFVIVASTLWFIIRCCCLRSPRSSKADFQSGLYRPLHDPASASAINMQPMAPPPQQNMYSGPYYSSHHR